jgi:S1-C subfamily serine protease
MMDQRPFYRAMGLSLMLLSIALPAYALADVLPAIKAAVEPTVQVNRDCTGTVVLSAADNKGVVESYILTARHCVDGQTAKVHTVYVANYDDGRIVSEVAYKARASTCYGHALALLKLIDTKTVLPSVAKIAARDVGLFEGEPVTVIGHPAGLRRTVVTGQFGGRDSVEFPARGTATEYFRASPIISGGNSGGPLFHQAPDGSYELIGVVSAGIPGTAVSLFVPIDAVRDYLDSALLPPVWVAPPKPSFEEARRAPSPTPGIH